MKVLPQFEAKWQKAWEKAQIFHADPDTKRKKFFVTFPYSYANGPLHVGHAFTAARVDAFARFKRMQGFNVLFPWAWHWTGQAIAGASERIRSGDTDFIKALREIDGVSELELQRFTDPEYMAQYYTRENRTTVRSAGFSIDWRREFNTTTPAFSRFVEWQYKKLRNKGYVTKGTHPVVWCTHCKSPTGDHDRQEGEGVSPEEYVLIKFRYNDSFLPAATFRPETIFGVTNIWMNPDAEYVEAEVNGEKWVISHVAARKLKEQKRDVHIIRCFKGRKLIGKEAVAPLIERRVPILPARFVDADYASGIVYSVPAHAPFDWLALKDLQKDSDSLMEYEIPKNVLKRIQPISIIRTEGFDDYPAAEAIIQVGAKDQCDPKAEKATKLVYKKEFHKGVLKENCGKYAGKTVQEIKPILVKDLANKNSAETMYDLPQPVMCRCLHPCIVKVLEEQWFLKYSDGRWKNRAKEALDQATICPETATQWFLATIDWLRDWPCARRSGLGTPLPWDKEWIIETLSDSTIYMAFYTINKQIREHEISPEKLTSDVFNWIFYEEGDRDEVAEKAGIDKEVLQEMRDEFTYWYPVDMRNSAKELIPNHLTFFLFQHAALFPREHWPKMIGANGMLMKDRKKMSKSKGNFVTFRGALEQYGADATRCALLLGAEGMDDPEWRIESVQDATNKLESFYKLSKTISEGKFDDYRSGQLEAWLVSILQHRIQRVTDNLEKLKTRTALENAFFEVWNDFRWYTRRKGSSQNEVLKEALKTWVKLLTPFIPHLCEEVWRDLGNEGFVALTDWPKSDDEKKDPAAEEGEALVKAVLDDSLSIIQATKTKPKRICLYVVADWKWEIFLEGLTLSLKEDTVQNHLMKQLMQSSDKRMGGVDKETARFTSNVVSQINRMPRDRRERLLLVGKINEDALLRKAKSFLEAELDSEVLIYGEGETEIHDPKNRAKLAKPYRPGIYHE
ncbi:MAG: leucine--tRNA ligase [Candidatus Bathyarchaeia archaeon]